MKKLFIFAISIFISGCLAATRVDVPLNYSYSGLVEAKPANITKAVEVAKVIDNRTVDTPDIIKHFRNTTGGLVAEKPVAQIVQEGLMQALKKSGYSLSSNDIILKTTIEDYSFDMVSGAFSMNRMNSTVSISILLEDRKETKLAKNMVIGKGNLNKDEIEHSMWWSISTGKVFKRALDDALRQIVEIVNIELARKEKFAKP